MSLAFIIISAVIVLPLGIIWGWKYFGKKQEEEPEKVDKIE